MRRPAATVDSRASRRAGTSTVIMAMDMPTVAAAPVQAAAVAVVAPNRADPNARAPTSAAPASPTRQPMIPTSAASTAASRISWR